MELIGFLKQSIGNSGGKISDRGIGRSFACLRNIAEESRHCLVKGKQWTRKKPPSYDGRFPQWQAGKNNT